MTTNVPAVIGIYAPRPQSGKSTMVDYLVNVYGPAKGIRFVRVKMAEPLKEPLYAIGLTDDEIEGPLKELPCAKLNGAVPRQVMIDFYKDGAKRFGPGWLTEIARRKVATLSAEGYVVLIDDVRRPTDYAMVRSFASGIAVRIERPDNGNQPEGGAERIEGELEHETFNARLTNSGTIADLHRQIDTALAAYLPAKP